jgi:hypothetical protein
MGPKVRYTGMAMRRDARHGQAHRHWPFCQQSLHSRSRDMPFDHAPNFGRVTRLQTNRNCQLRFHGLEVPCFHDARLKSRSAHVVNPARNPQFGSLLTTIAGNGDAIALRARNAVATPAKWSVG